MPTVSILRHEDVMDPHNFTATLRFQNWRPQKLQVRLRKKCPFCQIWMRFGSDLAGPVLKPELLYGLNAPECFRDSDVYVFAVVKLNIHTHWATAAVTSTSIRSFQPY